MLKYVDTKVCFQEVPDEITLCINISNCPCHCKGCHSAYLAEDIGTPLTKEELKKIIPESGITCVAFMGGDSNPEEVRDLASFLKKSYPELKVAWYSGKEYILANLDDLDYLKMGPYKEECGPLNKDTTNQKFFKVIHLRTGENRLSDITYKFWKHD